MFDFNNDQLSLMDEEIAGKGMISVIAEGRTDDDIQINEDQLFAVLPLRNVVLFPGVVLPIAVGRKKSLRLIKEYYQSGEMIAVTAQKSSGVDEPEFADLYPNGVLANVVKVFEMPDSTTMVVLEGRSRIELKSIEENKPFYKGKVSLLSKKEPEDERVYRALVEALKDLALRIIKNSNMMPKEATFALKNMENPEGLINYICAHFPLRVEEKQHLLEFDNGQDRGYHLLELLTKETQLLDLKLSIQAKAKEDMDIQQREYYLHQQMKAIQDELGGDGRSIELREYRKRAMKKHWSKKIEEVFQKEINKLERMSSQSPDYGIQSNYIETMLNMPWGEYTTDKFDLKKAKKILDKDHFGMENVKERIIEYLAVLKLKGDMKAPIICLHGSPGVGKTSLGKSIATSLGRNYVRMSLGGLHDEAEIRGHRRTYIGAMPGRIVYNMVKAQSANPVFVLDEIDKVTSSVHGDPSSALLEVLDPEQNMAFHDNYLDIDVDLSKVLFIATANDISAIPKPLLDRMELIEVSGYVAEEKVEIASKHLLPKQLEANGVKKSQVVINKQMIREIVDSYTRESGVRELDRKIAKLMRKVACRLAMTEDQENTKIEITKKNLKEFLGNTQYSHDVYQGNEYCGVVTGLAWTAVGGEILFIESSLNKVKSGGKLTLTGNLGDVMKESAILALEYIKGHAQDFGIDNSLFEENNIHVHVPEGAVPKDGPSAGITMVTSLVSTMTQRKVKKSLAMTGEITLRGKVLPVGGIREKILAAKRAGITEIILCEENQKHVEEINSLYTKGLTFHYVSDIKDVIKIALI